MRIEEEEIKEGPIAAHFLSAEGESKRGGEAERETKSEVEKPIKNHGIFLTENVVEKIRHSIDIATNVDRVLEIDKVLVEMYLSVNNSATQIRDLINEIPKAAKIRLPTIKTEIQEPLIKLTNTLTHLSAEQIARTSVVDDIKISLEMNADENQLEVLQADRRMDELQSNLLFIRAHLDSLKLSVDAITLHLNVVMSEYSSLDSTNESVRALKENAGLLLEDMESLKAESAEDWKLVSSKLIDQ